MAKGFNVLITDLIKDLITDLLQALQGTRMNLEFGEEIGVRFVGLQSRLLS
jgi:hypothetical protein